MIKVAFQQIHLTILKLRAFQRQDCKPNVTVSQLTKDRLSQLPNLSTAEDISFSEKPISNN